MDAAALRASWVDAWRGLGIERPDAPGDDSLFIALLTRYSEPQRHYHTLQHLGECLALLAQHRAAAQRPSEVALGLWFHDAIYDVERHDNEALSAAWAREALTQAGLPNDVAARVHDLVMATRHGAAPEPVSGDAALLVDIDLSILGAAPERFAQYERQIRTEYAHVPPPLFEPRRRAILAHFLERQPLYRTAGLRAAREAQARINIQSAIDASAAAAFPVEELLALAVQRINAGDRVQASALCDQAMAVHPPHAAVFQLRAWLMLQDGAFAQAREHAARSLALRPDHGPTLALAGDIAFELALQLQDGGDLAGAADALRSALGLKPHYAEAEVNLGIVLQESGDMAGAMQAYGRAYRLREDSFGRIAHALAAAATGQVWLDLDALRQALRTLPAT